MKAAQVLTLLAVASGISARYTATGTSAVNKAAATALTLSPTSNVKGKAFDRFVTIWLENTNYALASKDPDLAFLAKQGILLTNYNAVTHPSEPNYISSHGGDYFGMDNDNFNTAPKNVSTVTDLLDAAGISWGEYQQNMPYSGFEGFAWVNEVTGANDYVRKHNPAVVYASNHRTDRLAVQKNFTLFYRDLRHNQLPQWMFITPNMTSDGHDTSVVVAGAFTRQFLAPLLKDPHFNKNTLVQVVFDENESYPTRNRVYSLLLGSAVPQALHGSTDSHYYNHYSQLSSVEANWGLHTLGRWDVGANVFSVVAQQTGDKLRAWRGPPAFSNMYFNSSYPGPFNSVTPAPWPAPNIDAVHNGRTVLPSIKRMWAGAKKTYYTTDVEIPDGQYPPTYSSE